MISEKEVADFLARAGRCDGGLSQTLVISARDDPLAPYRFAAAAVGRIPGGRLVTIERGGHLFPGARRCGAEGNQRVRGVSRAEFCPKGSATGPGGTRPAPVA